MRFLFLSGVLAAAACASVPAPRPAPRVALERIAEGVYIHKSWKKTDSFGTVLSQGLVVVAGDRAAIVDSAWSDEDTLQLLDLIRTQTKAAALNAVVTHAHEDRMGGVGALRSRGVRVHATRMTDRDAARRGLSQVDRAFAEPFSEGTVAAAPGGPELVVFYPGAAHTRDNVVVYYAPAKILFGGCLVRPKESADLGYTEDGDVANWAEAARRVAARFPDAEIVVPSHGAPGGRELLDHTIALAEAAATKQ